MTENSNKHNMIDSYKLLVLKDFCIKGDKWNWHIESCRKPDNFGNHWYLLGYGSDAELQMFTELVQDLSEEGFEFTFDDVVEFFYISKNENFLYDKSRVYKIKRFNNMKQNNEKKCISAQVLDLKKPVFVFSGTILERYDNMLVAVFDDGTKQACFIDQKYPKFVDVEENMGVVPRDGGQFTQKDFDSDIFNRYAIYSKAVDNVGIDEFYKLAYEAGLSVHKMKADLKENPYYDNIAEKAGS